MHHPHPARRAPLLRLLPVFLVTLLATGCDSNDAGQEGEVDFERLFAPATQAEIDAVAAEWTTRDVSARNVQVAHTAALTLAGQPATLRVVSHTVAGATHYGAIVVPDGKAAGSLPVLVVGHGGDTGLNLDELLVYAAAFGEMADNFVYVFPSYRSEALVYQNVRYTSTGTPSPWDYDADDALALLNVTLATTSEASRTQIGVLGFSRGAGVSLLMAIRDPRIDVAVEFFGPTDFFGEFAQDVFRQALDGTPPALPGVSYLTDTFVKPLQRGDLSIEAVRRELVRRSAVLFVDRLPQVQLHHGTADETVPFSQGNALNEAMHAAGRTSPGFEAFLYPGGGHHPLTLNGSLDRAAAFIARLLAPVPA